MATTDTARDGAAASRQLPGDWRPLGALPPLRSAPAGVQAATQALDRGTLLAGAHFGCRTLNPTARTRRRQCGYKSSEPARTDKDLKCLRDRDALRLRGFLRAPPSHTHHMKGSLSGL